MKYGLAGLESIIGGAVGGGGGGTDLFPVRVTDIVLDDKHPKFSEVGEWNGLGTIFFTSVEFQTNSDVSNRKARPGLSNLKQYPLINEIVYLYPLPVATSQNSGTDAEFYYFDILNVWNSQHHNALPNGIILSNSENASSDYQQTEAGNVRRVKDESTEINLGKTFIERLNINPLLPYEGDVMYEGRWGNSIRFGSTVNNANIANSWSSVGTNGDPITIIRNGENPDNGDEGWVPVIEDINKDISSIWLGSTQKLPLTAASTKYDSYTTAPTSPSEYQGSQIIFNSNRLVLNTKEDHLLLSSKKSINLGAVESVNVDTKDYIVKASSIKLGSKDADEPLLLGNKTVDLLGKILDEVVGLSTQLSSLASLPPGTPFIPLNAQAVQSQIKLNLYKNQLKTLLSKQNTTI